MIIIITIHNHISYFYLHDLIVCYKGSLLVFGGFGHVSRDLQTAYNDFVLYDPGTIVNWLFIIYIFS